MRRDPDLRQILRQRLDATALRTLDESGLKHAAVVIVVVDEGPGAGLPGFAAHQDWSDSAAFVLTRRAGHLARHAGQWALPGGRVDAGEADLEAALRELHEELGLELSPADVLGRLDDYATRSGYRIRPFVVWGGSAASFAPDPAEVASAHRIPLTELLRDDAPILDPPHAGHAHAVLRMPLGTAWVAAPTAAILYQFREWCLLGRDTRVAHFDQPRFTWR